MKALIAGGSGFLGRALAAALVEHGHEAIILGRGLKPRPESSGITRVQWDGRTVSAWSGFIEEVDAVVNLAGKSLLSWPWTSRTRQDFLDSRVQPGRALARAIKNATHKPKVFVQASGINHYGLEGKIADESTPPGDDFLGRLTIDRENSTRLVEEAGVRRVVIRSAVVLAANRGMLPLISLPVKLMVAGPIAGGKQALPWIHLDDEIGAISHLIAQDDAQGPYNFIAPEPTSNSGFMSLLARVLRRPYWFPVPGILLRAMLGGMSVLVVNGRFASPKRLLESGYNFKFPALEPALQDIFAR